MGRPVTHNNKIKMVEAPEGITGEGFFYYKIE